MSASECAMLAELPLTVVVVGCPLKNTYQFPPKTGEVDYVVVDSCDVYTRVVEGETRLYVKLHTAHVDRCRPLRGRTRK